MNKPTDIKTRFPREAAVLSLEQRVLGTPLSPLKSRGDRITAREIVDATGWQDWKSFGGRIRTWAKRSGFVLFAEPNDGWRIGTAADHNDYAFRGMRSSLRKNKRALLALVSAPDTELDDSQVRRKTHLVVRCAVQVTQAEKHDQEIRIEFKLGRERVPLKLAK